MDSVIEDPTDAPSPGLVGQQIGKYHIIRQIGAGAMGEVFEAVHEDIGQRLAVKFLRGGSDANAVIIRRFFDEARVAGIVKHPGIVKVFDFGSLPDGTLYIMMELLEGEPLEQRLRQHRDLGRRLPTSEALHIARQLASALAAVHKEGIIHRDLKPDNIFLVPDPDTPTGERAKILDFGIARFEASAGTATGALMGTPSYMAPEQCEARQDITDRVDVYALGVILYSMLAGRPPFRGSVKEVLGQHLVAQPRPLLELQPAAPPDAAVLVHAMLAKDPKQRPAMAEVLLSINVLEGRLGAGDGMAGTRWTARAGSFRLGKGSWAAPALLLLGLGASLWLSRPWARLRAAPAAAAPVTAAPVPAPPGAPLREAPAGKEGRAARAPVPPLRLRVEGAAVESTPGLPARAAERGQQQGGPHRGSPGQKQGKAAGGKGRQPGGQGNHARIHVPIFDD